MIILVESIGIVMMIAGIAFLFKPEAMRKMIDFWAKGKRLYLGGIINLIIGILLLSASSVCAIAWFVRLIGIISLLKAIVIFVLGPKKLFPLAERLLEGSSSSLRFFSVLAVLLGILLIFTA
ncbi:MAG: hypothetical protein ABH872_07040 [Candidatus Omnitrophota bacterium]